MKLGESVGERVLCSAAVMVAPGRRKYGRREVVTWGSIPQRQVMNSDLEVCGMYTLHCAIRYNNNNNVYL